MRSVLDITDETIVKAMGHPTRARILAILEQRTDTPKRLAEELGVALEPLSYHVRLLAKAGLIELVEQTTKGGAVEHHYRAAAARMRISDDTWRALPDVARYELIRASLEQVGGFATDAAERGGFDRPRAHITRRALELDDQGFRELADLLETIVEKMNTIQDDAKLRAVDGASDGRFTAGVAMMLFDASRTPERYSS